MVKQTLTKRSLALLVMLAMLMGMVPSAFAYGSTTFTNPTVDAALTAMGPSAGAVGLDFTGQDVAGAVDLGELTSEFPGLAYVNLTGTNVTEVTGSAPVLVDTGNTFIDGGKTIAVRTGEDNTVVFDKEAPAAVTISDLTDKLAVQDAATGGELSATVPAALLDVVTYSLDGGAPVSSPAIPAATLDGLSQGAHTLDLNLTAVGGTGVYAMVRFNLQVRDVSYTLTTASATPMIYAGGNEDFTLKKFDNDGAQMAAGDPSDFTYQVFDSMGILLLTVPAASVTASGQELEINVEIPLGTPADTYTLRVTENAATGRRVEMDFAVNVLTLPSDIALEVVNGTTAETPYLAATSGASNVLLVDGGTGVASQTMAGLSGYTDTTYLRLVDETTHTPLGAEYLTLITASCSSANFRVERVRTANGEAALTVTSLVPAEHGATHTVTVNVTGAAAPLTFSVANVQAQAEEYLVYQVDGAYAGSDLEADINDGAVGTLVSRYTWDGADYDRDAAAGPALMEENTTAVFVLAAKYPSSGRVYLVAGGPLSHWYDFDNPGSTFPSAPLVDDFVASDKLHAGVRLNWKGTRALEVTADSGSGGVTGAQAVASVNDGSATRAIGLAIDVAGRTLKEYVFLPGDAAIVGTVKRTAWLASGGTELTAATVDIGTTERFKVGAVYSNDDLELVSDVSALAPAGSDGSLLSTVTGSGYILSVTATDRGGVNDAKAGSAATVTVSGGGKNAALPVTLGNSRINGMTYYYETPDGAGTGVYGSIDTTTVWKDDPANASGGVPVLEIPRGLSAKVWPVFTFTNTEIMSQDPLTGDWQDYMVPTGVTVDAGQLDSGSGSAPYAVSAKNSMADAPETNADITFGMRYTVTGTILPVNGKNHGFTTAVTGTTMTLSVPVRVVEPLVESVRVELYHGGTGDYVGGITPQGGGVHLVDQAYVGEELKLRVKVKYTDGKDLDAILGDTTGLDDYFKNGVYFMPEDTCDTYDPTVGPTTTPADIAAAVGADAYDVLRAYLLGRQPSVYGNLLMTAPIAAAGWNGSMTADQIVQKLKELTTRISIISDAAGGTELDATYLNASDGTIMPGHYSVKLQKDRGSAYELRFESKYTANGFHQTYALKDLDSSSDELVLKVDPDAARLEAVRLVGGNTLSYDAVNDQYNFDNTPTVGGGYRSFWLYPVLVDTRWYMDEGAATPIKTHFEDSEVGAKRSLNYLPDGFTGAASLSLVSADPAKLSVGALAIGPNGKLGYEVTVLSEAVTPVALSFTANLPLPLADYTTDPAKVPSPVQDSVRVVAVSEGLVEDIVAQNQTVGPIYGGDPVSYKIQYREQGNPSPKDLTSYENGTAAYLPGMSGYAPSGTNPHYLRVEGSPANPAFCTFTYGPSSTLVFTPTLPGNYTFTLYTYNKAGVVIPGDPGTGLARTITFTVDAATVNTDLYYAQVEPLPGFISGYTVTETSGSALDAGLLSGGVMKMTGNAPGTATVELRNGGDLMQVVQATLHDRTPAVTLTPAGSAAAPYMISEGGSVNMQWRLDYPAVGTVPAAVEYQPAALTYVTGTAGSFLTASGSNGLYTAAAPAGAPAGVLTGVYQAVDPVSGAAVTFFARLDTAAVTVHTYEVREGVTPVTSLSMTAGDPAAALTLWQDGAVQQSAYTAVSSSAAVTLLQTGMDTEVYPVSNGTAVITFTATDGGTAAVTVSVSGGSVTAPVSITTQPASQTVAEGASALFTVAAGGGDGTYTYQWERSNDSGATWNVIAGANGASYTTPAATAADNGSQYRCVVSSSGATATSNGATLTVTAVPTVLTITTQPVGVTALAGDPVAFTVAAAGGTAPYAYQWEFQPAGGGAWTAVPGATAASYSFTASPADAGQYRCVVTDSAAPAAAVTSGGASLLINTPATTLSITTQPADQTASVGGSAAFTVAASTTAPPPAAVSYQWYRWNTGTNSWDIIPGATSGSYTVSAVAAADDGAQFYCAVTDGTDTLNSCVASLHVSALSISAQPANQTVTAGGSATFTVAAAGGSGVYTYQWESKTASGAWTAISGATGASCVVSGTTTAMSGNQYRCVVSDGGGTVTSNAALLTVNASGGTGGGGGGGGGGGSSSTALAISKQPASLSVESGASASFAVTASGGSGTLTYQWQSKTGSGAWADVSGATAASYIISAVTEEMDGVQYRCVVKDSKTSVTSSAATLTVKAAAVTPGAGFTDVPEDHWAYEEIMDLVNKGVISGKGGGLFDPDGLLTRDEFAAFIAKGMGWEQGVTAAERSAAADHFADWSSVPDWARNSWAAVYGRGVMLGTLNAGSYAADGARGVSRQEVCVTLARLLSNAGRVELTFDDAGEIAAWALPGVENCFAEGLVTGFTDNTFRPENNISRAECAVLLSRFLAK